MSPEIITILVAIIGATITLAGLLIALIRWLRADLHRHIDKTEETFRREIDGLKADIRETNQRIDKTNQRIDELYRRIDKTNLRIDDLYRRIDELYQRIDGLYAIIAAGQASEKEKKMVAVGTG